MQTNSSSTAVVTPPLIRATSRHIGGVQSMWRLRCGSLCSGNRLCTSRLRVRPPLSTIAPLYRGRQSTADQTLLKTDLRTCTASSTHITSTARVFAQRRRCSGCIQGKSGRQLGTNLSTAHTTPLPPHPPLHEAAGRPQAPPLPIQLLTGSAWAGRRTTQRNPWSQQPRGVLRCCNSQAVSGAPGLL